MVGGESVYLHTPCEADLLPLLMNDYDCFFCATYSLSLDLMLPYIAAQACGT